MNCPECAKTIRGDARQCKHCGADVKTGPNPLLIVGGVLGAIALGVVALAALIVVPNLIKARKHGNEAAAIGALKTVTTAQSLFREGDKEMDTNFDYGSLQELSDAALVDSLLGMGVKQGYVFTVEPSPTTSEFLWFATANPKTPGTTGDRFFATNQSGIVYYSETGPIRGDDQCRMTGDATMLGR